MVAAALRTDGLRVSISEGDRDPLDEIRAERPDIVLVRAEARGKESGYTLLSRVKRNKRLQMTPVFLYTSDGTAQTIETHKTKDTPADDYLIVPNQPPYPLEELRDRVRNVLFPPGGVDKPPPLPAPKPDVKAVTQEDTAFIEQVMDSLSSTESEDLVPPAPVKREGSFIGSGRRTTADAKLDMLREKLRQRESDLARVMEMYRAKEREYHQFNEKLVEKDVEAQSLKMTLDELTTQLEAARVELEKRTSEFNASFELLLEEKVNRENELIQVVAGREKAVNDLATDLRRSEETGKTRVSTLESALAETDQEREKAEARAAGLETDIAERERAIEALRREIDEAAARHKALEQGRDQHAAKVSQHEERILILEDTILELRSDLSLSREEADRESAVRSEEIVARDGVIQGLAADLEDTETAFAQADQELRAQIARLGERLDDREQALEALKAEKAELDRRLADRETEWTHTKADLETRLAHREHELEAARAARVATEDSLNASLAVSEDRIESLLTERETDRTRFDDLDKELRATIQTKEEAIEALDRKLKEIRGEHANTQAALKEEIDRLESVRLSTEHALAERETELEELRQQSDRRLAEHKEALERAQEELRRAGERITEEQDRIASLEAQLAEEGERYQQLHKEAELESDRLTDELSRLERELAETRTHGESIEAELRDQVIQLGSDLAAKGEELDAAANDLTAEKRERMLAERNLSSLEDSLRQARADLEATIRDLRSSERDLAQARETVALREGRLTELQQALHQDREALSRREQELIALRADYDARAAELGRLQGRIAVLDDNLSTARRDAQASEARSTDLSDQLTNHKAQLAAARAEGAERATRLEEASRTLQQREEELAKQREQFAHLAAERERLAKDRDGLTTERDRLVAEAGRLSARAAQLAEELDALQDRADALEGEVEGKTSRVEALTASLAAAEEQKGNLDRTRVQLTSDVARGQEAIARLQSELERNRQEWGEARAALTKERDAVRTRMAEIGKQLDETRDARDQAIHGRALLEEQSNARARMDAATQAALTKEMEGLKAARATREEELAQELDNRDAHLRTLDREIASAREELEGQRVLYEKALRDMEGLETSLDESRAGALAASHHAALEKQQLEARIAGLSNTMEATQATLEETKSSLESQLQSLNLHADGLERILGSERESRERERERMRSEVTVLTERLEETTSRVATLVAEKQSLDDLRRAEAVERDREILGLREQIEERKQEHTRAASDFGTRVDAVQARVAELTEALEASRRERDELETKYIREFEDAQEVFLRQTKEKEALHAREVEELRTGKLDAMRQLKTTQLAAQRLTDRVQKLETERPQKSEAEEEFDSFLRQLEPSGPKLPVPSAVPGPARAPAAPVKRPSTSTAAPGSRPPAPSTEARAPVGAKGPDGRPSTGDLPHARDPHSPPRTSDLPVTRDVPLSSRTVDPLSASTRDVQPPFRTAEALSASSRDALAQGAGGRSPAPAATAPSARPSSAFASPDPKPDSGQRPAFGSQPAMPAAARPVVPKPAASTPPQPAPPGPLGVGAHPPASSSATGRPSPTRPRVEAPKSALSPMQAQAFPRASEVLPADATMPVSMLADTLSIGDSMADEETSIDVGAMGLASPGGGSGARQIRRPIPARRLPPRPEVRAGSASGPPVVAPGASLTDDLLGADKESSDDFMAAFDREFEGIKKT